MTAEELNKVPFKFVAHLTMRHESLATYKNDDYDIGYCEHVIRRADGGFGRTYRHYRLRNKIYKTLPKFLEAIKDLKYYDGSNPDHTIFIKSKR